MGITKPKSKEWRGEDLLQITQEFHTEAQNLVYLFLCELAESLGLFFKNFRKMLLILSIFTKFLYQLFQADLMC